MRALRFLGSDDAAVVDVPPPEAAAGAAVVAPHDVGLCGTDLELLTGSMPYFREGVASYPLQPGHEVSGVVVESADPRFPPGTAVVVDPVVGCGSCGACATGPPTGCVDRRELGVRRGMPGGAAELVVVPTSNLWPVPAGLPLRDAVLAEPAVTVVNAVGRLAPSAGERAVVLGAGTIGLMAAQLLVDLDVRVDVLEPGPQRQDVIAMTGATPVTTLAESSYDLAVEAAGAGAAVVAALSALRARGRVALVGVQPALVDGVDVNQVVLKDLTVTGVLNGPGLLGQALDAIARGVIDPAALIEAAYPLDDAVAALAHLRRPRARPKIVLQIAD